MVLPNCCKLLDDGGKKNKLAAILLDKIIDILKKQVKSWRVLWICVTQFPPVLFVWLVVGCFFFFTFFLFFCQNDKTTKKKEKKRLLMQQQWTQLW